MLIFALEGVHGAGKTTLLEYFDDYIVNTCKKRRIPCLTDDFNAAFQATDFAKVGHMGSTSQAMGYLAHWLMKVRKFISENPNACSVVIDRSLLSAAFYAEDEIDGERILRLLPKLYDDLAKEGHTVITVYLRRNIDTLRKHIHKRLMGHPLGLESRKTAVIETDDNHLKATLAKYEEYDKWDCILDVETGIPISRPWRCVLCPNVKPQDDLETTLTSLSRTLHWEINSWELIHCVERDLPPEPSAI